MKILVADPYPIMRYGLRQLFLTLDRHAQIVECDDLDVALGIIKNSKEWDLVLIDPVLVRDSESGLIEEFTGMLSGTPLVLYPVIGKRQNLLQDLQRGATGFIPKWVSCEQFIEMVSSVMAGLPCMPWSILDDAPWKGDDHVMTAALNADIQGLTPRQREVLACLAKGFTNAEIARRLGISAQTVRHHISAILVTLNVENRTQAALVAMQAITREAESSTDTASPAC